jgi:hypothetical protein
MPSVPVTIYLGNVQVTPVYQGRSGCCIGEDQIVFTVPVNAPTGCAVPLSIQANGSQSNTVQIPIAPLGSRTCPPTSPAFTTAGVVSLAAGGFANIADITLLRSDSLAQNNTPGFEDDLAADVVRIGFSPAIQPFAFSYIDVPPIGTCAVYNTPNGQPDPPALSILPLDAGPQITVQGPNGSKNVPAAGGLYRGVLSATGNFLVPGAFTVTAPGGKDVPGFSAQISIPAMPVMTSPAPDTSTSAAVTRGNGFTVTWTGGTAAEVVLLDGIAATDNSFNTGLSFECVAPAAAGSFTIPPNITQVMPATNFGALFFHPAVLPQLISGTKLDFAALSVRFETYAPLQFK